MSSIDNDSARDGHVSERLASLIMVGMGLLVPLSFWEAPYPYELVLQHVPTLIALPCIVWGVQRPGLSWLTFGCIVAFTLIHLLGARWIYSFVPYDDWYRWLSGETLSSQFGWERNHYDRFVHFMFGVLAMPPLVELGMRGFAMKRRVAVLMAISSVWAIGGFYEVVEWGIAFAFSPETAESYNGQQGDMWDAQKDLALAGLGSLLVTPWLWTFGRAN